LNYGTRSFRRLITGFIGVRDIKKLNSYFFVFF
jgi:hypothetical protein